MLLANYRPTISLRVLRKYVLIQIRSRLCFVQCTLTATHLTLISICSYIRLSVPLRGGTWFRDLNRCPKRSTKLVNFFVGFEITPFHKPQKNLKWQIRPKTVILQHQSIDNILPSSHKCQPDWSKNGWVMAKKRMPLYEIIYIFRDFLAHHLNKYQYFSMRLSLFV